MENKYLTITAMLLTFLGGAMVGIGVSQNKRHQEGYTIFGLFIAILGGVIIFNKYI